MKRKYTTLASTVLFAVLVLVGTAFCLGNSTSMNGKHPAKQTQVVKHSVIKVHTNRGVITIPGRADSWDEVENAEFVAERLARVQTVNNQSPLRPTTNQ